MTRVGTPAEDQIFIDVPALVSADLFAAAQDQLEENRKRRRVRAHGASDLLPGLIVCKGCGYAGYGVTSAPRMAEGRSAYSSYRCRGSEADHFGGQRLCRNKPIRRDRLDAAVWEDVSALLSEPGVSGRSSNGDWKGRRRAQPVRSDN